MKIFLSAIEGQKEIPQIFAGKMKWNLMSYYVIRKKTALAEYVRDNSEEILIDSGAHSFQKGKKVEWVKYTQEFADFIKKYDRPNVIGYFEMDVDNIIGYEKVLELRKILENVSDKIIPVWHYNRGIDDYIQMCKNYAGKIIAITGFKGAEIRDDQYLMFVKVAKKYGCKVHCLGMTRTDVLDKVPFDYVDSSSWLQNGVYGNIVGKGKVSLDYSKKNGNIIFLENYKAGMKMQEHYYEKWKKICKD